MKTVAVLNRKGGVGKTTLATNLARSFQLRGHDVILLVELIKARQEVTGRPEAAFVVSRAITGTRLADSAREALKRLELPVLSAQIHQRVAYAEAAGRGLSVLDLSDEKAAGEIEALTRRDRSSH